jgi:hypothetical protein
MSIRALSPLPIVNLRDIGVPADGLLIETPRFCKRMFNKTDECKLHYQRLAAERTSQVQMIQCPHGFSSFSVDINGDLCCLTAIIPFPRMGGKAERRLAKAYPVLKYSIQAVRKMVDFLLNVGVQLNQLRSDTIRSQSFSLHEIRKLNRTIKHEAERLCSAHSNTDPELADPQLVKIWKSSELMSAQFDVIELLATRELFNFPTNCEMEIYKLVDKCVRIYRPANRPNRLTIRAPYGFHAKIAAYDKTIQIIPTVLIAGLSQFCVNV